MTEHLTDRMPEVAAGGGEWSPDECSHLAACRDCRLEWRLVQRVRADATPPDLDLDGITAGVLSGLRERPRVLALRRPLVPIALATAASLALALTLWGPTSPANQPVDTAVGAEYAPTLFPELDELLDSELEVVLATMESTGERAAPIGDVPRLGDLTDDELEQLLDVVEG